MSQIAGILGTNVASVFGAAMDADAREGQVVIGLNLVTHGNYLNLNTSVDIFGRLDVFLGFVGVDEKDSLKGRVVISEGF